MLVTDTSHVFQMPAVTFVHSMVTEMAATVKTEYLKLYRSFEGHMVTTETLAHQPPPEFAIMLMDHREQSWNTLHVRPIPRNQSLLSRQ